MIKIALLVIGCIPFAVILLSSIGQAMLSARALEGGYCVIPELEDDDPLPVEALVHLRSEEHLP